MATVQLDIAHDITLGEFLDMVDQFQLEFKVIANRGPAGGNPFIEFTGDNDSIRALQEEFE